VATVAATAAVGTATAAVGSRAGLAVPWPVVAWARLRAAEGMGRFVAAALLVVLIDRMGWLDFVDRYLADARASLGSRAATGEVVVVGIDALSLRRLEQWPWPRRRHAELIDRLLAAGVGRIAIDIDFSSRSKAEDDRRLAKALAVAGPERVALPVFRQVQPTADGAGRLEETAPGPAFRRHASLAGASLVADEDGRARRVPLSDRWRDGRHPAMAAWLVEMEAPEGTIALDFSIDVETLPYLSYVDVLAGAFDPAMLEGKRVLVGAVDLALGDSVAVPRYSTLPGVAFHALAAETLLQDRALVRIGGWPTALAAAGLVILLGMVGQRWRPVWKVTLFASALAGPVAAATLLQPLAGINLEAMPFILAWSLAGLVLLIGILQRLAAQRAAARREAERRFTELQAVVENSFDAILTFAEDGRIAACNPSAEAMFARPAEELRGEPLSALLPSAVSDELVAAVRAGAPLRRDIAASLTDGSRFSVECALGLGRSGDDGFLGILAMRDNSERRAQAAALSHLASHDPLTGLLNRGHFRERLEQATARARQRGGRLACLLVDLDRFKEINDTLGHRVGDRMLEAIAPRLRGLLAEPHLIARQGGDEFALLLDPVSDEAMAAAVAGRVLEALREPFVIDGRRLSVDASVGIALHPDHGDTAELLLQRADVAMYQAKAGHEGFLVYDAARDHHSARRLALIGDLRRAVTENTLQLAYQPKIELGMGRLAGVEALLRWQHSSLGRIGPGEFVPIAEAHGLIDPMTLNVVRMAIAQSRRWREEGLRLAIAVNLSARSLENPAFAERLLETIESEAGSPETLAFEVTESTFIADTGAAVSILEDLARRGFELALDDFGTGYSSFAYLRSLPVHTLKIDRAFVQGRSTEPGGETVLQTIIDLAQRLGLKTVAEGVEDQATLDWLIASGCREAQGFHLGAPMSPEGLSTQANRLSSRTAAGHRCSHLTAPEPAAALQGVS